jgi:hypothetical protein
VERVYTSRYLFAATHCTDWATPALYYWRPQQHVTRYYPWAVSLSGGTAGSNSTPDFLVLWQREILYVGVMFVHAAVQLLLCTVHTSKSSSLKKKVSPSVSIYSQYFPDIAKLEHFRLPYKVTIDVVHVWKYPRSTCVYCQAGKCVGVTEAWRHPPKVTAAKFILTLRQAPESLPAHANLLRISMRLLIGNVHGLLTEVCTTNHILYISG